MRKQAVTQACENSNMEGTLAALGKSIAHWTEQGTQLLTAVPVPRSQREHTPKWPHTKTCDGTEHIPSCLVSAKAGKRRRLPQVGHFGGWLPKGMDGRNQRAGVMESCAA
jgi:hypothetical protein